MLPRGLLLQHKNYDIHQTTEALKIRYYDKQKDLLCLQEKKKASAASVSVTDENDSLETSNNQVAGVGT